MSYAIATSTVSVRAVIEAEIESVWAALGYTTDTIAFPNIYFTKPGNGPWIRVSYPQQTTVPYVYGNGVKQSDTRAILAIQIFVPKNAGAELLNIATDAFRANFERQAFGAGIRFFEAQGPGNISDDVWAGVLLSLPFQFFESIS